MATRDQPRFVAVAAAARSPAGDVVSALHELATLAGGATAADLATAWMVCETTGGQLAAPVARLAGAWRDDEQVRREVTAALAGPRATAVLLAGLPLAGLAMGAALGADPVALLRQPSVALVVLVPWPAPRGCRTSLDRKHHSPRGDLVTTPTGVRGR